MKPVTVIISICLLGISFLGKAYTLTDSVGTVKRSDKHYILYEVEQGETLYAILKKYNCTEADFKAANIGLTDKLNDGQVIKLPIITKAVVVPKPTTVASERVVKVIDEVDKSEKIIGPHLEKDDKKEIQEKVKEVEKAVSKTEAKQIMQQESFKTKKTTKSEEKSITATKWQSQKTHIVGTGESLFGIARKYNLTVEELRILNKLSSNDIGAGQVLIVSEAIVMPSKTDSLKNLKVKAKKDSVKVKDVPKKSAITAKIDSLRKTGVIYKNFEEKGIAELIEVDDNSGQHFALHRTAPKNTLIQIRNEANNKTVFAKVLGKLPDTGLNEKIIIRISPKAFEKLSPVDKKFRAYLKYIAPVKQ